MTFQQTAPKLDIGPTSN